MDSDSEDFESGSLLTRAEIAGIQQRGLGRGAKVPAIDKAVAILGELADASGMTLSELSLRTGLAPSSTHDICASLAKTGLVEKTRDGRYRLGLKVIELARRRLASMSIVSAFQNVCAEFPPPQTTVVLSVLGGGSDVVYVSFVDGHSPLAIRYEIGLRLPAAVTASGRAILATMPLADVGKLMGPSLEPSGKGRKREEIPADLMAELQATRERGFSIDDEALAPGMACIGAAVFGGEQLEAVGAVAVALVKRWDDWFDPDMADYVCDIADRISQQLGAKPRRKTTGSLSTPFLEAGPVRPQSWAGQPFDASPLLINAERGDQ